MLVFVASDHLVERSIADPAILRQRDRELPDLRQILQRPFRLQERQVSPVSARRLKCVVNGGEILSDHGPVRETVYKPKVLERRDVTEIPYQRAHQR